MRRPTRAQVRAFAQRVHVGDCYTNDRWEHGTPPLKRLIRVEYNARRFGLHVCMVLQNPQRPDQFGKLVTIRTRTLMERWLAAGGLVRRVQP
jgi:hypothetical protein